MLLERFVVWINSQLFSFCLRQFNSDVFIVSNYFLIRNQRIKFKESIRDAPGKLFIEGIIDIEADFIFKPYTLFGIEGRFNLYEK